MARVFRQQYTRPIPEDAQHTTIKNKKGEQVPAVRFKGSDGKMVTAPVTTKGKNAGKHCRIVSPFWYGRVKGVVVCLECTNKAAAEVKLNELILKAERRGAGMVDPFEKHTKRPLAEHLEDYRRALEAEDNVPQYVATVHSRLLALIEGCEFRFIPDVSASKAQDWLADLRKDRPRQPLPSGKEAFTSAEAAALLGMMPRTLRAHIRRHSLSVTREIERGPMLIDRDSVAALQERLCRGTSVQTTNQYRMHLKSFCGWLVKDGRTETNPVLHLEGGNIKLDRRHDRRELTAAQLSQVLDATRTSSRSFRGLAGEDRFMLYATACGTGFRSAALASLTPESFDLDGDQAVVTLPARRNKSRKTKVQPLPSDVAELLRAYLTGKPAKRPVWPGQWKISAADMLHADLNDAGIPYAVEGPDGPLYVDFHALRHTYLTLGGRAGIDLRTLQELAGHSTPNLTARYSHVRLHDLAGAVEKLPSFLPASDQQSGRQEQRLATGTEGSTPPQKIHNATGAYTLLTHEIDGESGSEMASDERGKGGRYPEPILNSLPAKGVGGERRSVMEPDAVGLGTAFEGVGRCGSCSSRGGGPRSEHFVVQSNGWLALLPFARRRLP